MPPDLSPSADILEVIDKATGNITYSFDPGPAAHETVEAQAYATAVEAYNAKLNAVLQSATAMFAARKMT